MSANLNQSKTKFLLIGLPQQLFKVSDATLFMPSNCSIEQFSLNFSPFFLHFNLYTELSKLIINL